MASTRICLFDAYGTLFNLESVVAASAARLGSLASALLRLWRQKQLEYTWLRTLMHRHAPFDQVTAEALGYTLRALDIADPGLAKELLESYDRVSPYPDVVTAIEALGRGGIKSGILSNGTPAMLRSALGASGIERLFSYVISVETTGCYKPDPRVYALAASETGSAKETIVFVSSNPWDVAGAVASGLRVIWVNRGDAPPEALPGKPAATIRSLSELVEVVGGSGG